MQNTKLSDSITQLDCIKKKIHKIKPQNEKFQNNIKLCPYPPGMQINTQNLYAIRLSIPLSSLNLKETILEEQILWDFEDNYSDEQLFRNLFAIIIDLLEDKYPKNVTKLSAIEAHKIIEDCLYQVKQAIENHKKYKHIQEILAFEQFIDKNDSMINLQINTSKIKEVIQWDLENAFNYIDKFVYEYCYENKLDKENFVLIGNQIREQIQNVYEKRFCIAQKLLLEDQTEFKQKLISYLDYPSFEPYQSIKYVPQNNELNMFLKKNIEFLPDELQILYGQKPKIKQILDLGVDQDDIKKFEKEFNQKSKYLNQTILSDLINKTKQN